MSRMFCMRVSVALAAATLGSGVLQAFPATTYKLGLSTSSFTSTCSTATGPGAATTITVKPTTALTGSNTIVVTLSTVTGGIVVTAPTITTLSTTNQAAGIAYSVKAAVGCVGMTNAATPTFNFLANTGTGGAVADAPVTVTTTLTNTTSGLSLSSSLVMVNCVLNNGNYTPGVAQNVSVTSTATGGTPFTFSTSSLPAGVTVTPSSAGSGGGTASGSAMNYSFVAAAGCGGGQLGTTTGSLVLTNSPGPAVTISVVLQITPISPLVAAPSPATLTYTKGSGQPGTVTVNVTSSSSPAPFFTVDTTSLPSWLTVDAISGTTSKALHFSSTSICDSLAPGTYTAAVRLKVSTYGDLTVNFSLLITNSAPKLTVTQGAMRPWTMGQPLPVTYITLTSSDSPIAYTLTSGGPLAPVPVSGAQVSGLAYSFGTQIPIQFNSLVFAAAQPASVLTGTVTVTWGNPSTTTVVTFNITVQSPQATLSSISPASLPTAASGAQPFTVVLTGTGFVSSSDPTQKTKVGVVSSNVLIQDTNIAVNVTNASNMILTLTPATGDTYLNFAAGGTVILGVCNPQGQPTCTVPSATIALSIGNGPIIQGVASASSFQEVNPGQTQNIAQGDMISIFGTNFCSSSAPACSSSQILPGVLSSGTMVYQNWLSMDAAGATQRKLTVAFCPTGTTPLTPSNTCINAPLLFATNSQINLIAPSSLTAGATIDIIVGYGYGTTTNLVSSSPATVNVISTDPGTFAIGADGQGAGAILAQNWSVIGATNPAGMRSTAADSDTVQIYMTGLGVPNSTAANTSPAGPGPSTAPTDCVSIAAYLSAVNSANQGSAQLTSLDGAVIQSSLIASGLFPPCLSTNPTVTIGNQPVTSVTYAGWVDDSVAGLYQVNVTLPGTTPGSGNFIDVAGVSHTSITAPVQLPVVVTANGRQSQTGISVWVAPRLKVTPPTALTGDVGIAWASTNNVVVATEGQSPYRYAVTSGVLPTGLSLTASGQNAGTISGTPAADRSGSYVITVTATDSNSVPLTGTTTFTLTVNAGLVVTPNPLTYTAPVITNPLTTTTIETVAATGGAYPYTYSWDSSFTPPNLMLINSSTGAITITSQTPAGVYNVNVKATDANGVTGNATFTVTLNLVVSVAATTLAGTSPNLSGNAGTSYTVTLASVGGSNYVYTLAAPVTGFSINNNVLTVGTSAAAATAEAVVINVTESGQGTGTGTITLNFTLHLVVSAAAGSGISGTSPTFSGTAGGSLSVNLSASGGTSYTFAVNPSQSGFVASGSVLNITAPASGTAYNVPIVATDIVSGATGTLTLHITVGLTVTASAGTGGTTGTSPNFSGPASSAFTVTLAASGGTSYTFTTPSQGAQFSISGTTLTVNAPASGTAYTVVVNALDSGTQATGTLTLTITVGLIVSATGGTGITGTSPNFSGLAGGTLRVNLAATGGSSSIFYSTASQGGDFSITTNVLTIATSALATASGAPYTVVIQAQDNNSPNATGTLTLHISLDLTVTAGSPSSGLTGSNGSYTGTHSTPYTLTLAASGGSSNYLYTTTDSTGYFSINNSTLNINAPAATYTVTVNVLDTSSGATGSIQLTITMN